MIFPRSCHFSKCYHPHDFKEAFSTTTVFIIAAVVSNLGEEELDGGVVDGSDLADAERGPQAAASLILVFSATELSQFRLQLLQQQQQNLQQHSSSG